MKSLATVLMMMVAGAAVAAPQGGVHPLPTAPGSNLSGGLYYVTGNTTIDHQSAGQSGLYVNPGATTAIYIPKGVTLIVKGGNGKNAIGGGAGIRVPKNSTLVVTGGGTLKAIGGKAGNGSDGSCGNDAYVIEGASNHLLGSGTGGAGGAGGGGGGAGIGGFGGTGGGGGAGGGAVSDYWENSFFYSGNAGNAGNAGWNMGDCGTVVFMGNLTVEPQSGDAGEKGFGADGSMWVWKEGGYYYYGAWGGGGGGGGGAGGKPVYVIGYGGAGGGGGGGGGSGCLTYIHLASSFIAHNGWGKGGRGGEGGYAFNSVRIAADRGSDGKSCYGATCTDMDGVSGTWGRWNDEDYYQDSTRGGNGGSGGAGGGTPETDRVDSNYKGVSISSGVRVNNLDEKVYASKSVSTHPAVEYKIVFSDPQKLLVTTSIPSAETVYLGMTPPKVEASTTASEANAMLGWYDAKEGGTKYYDEKGNPTSDFATYENYLGDLTLYPQVHEAALTPTGVKVEGREIGGVGVEPPEGCIFGVATRLYGAGPFTLSGTNLNGLVRFIVEGNQEVAITIDGLWLKNERSNIGLIDISPGSSAVITLKGTANYLEATGESSSAIHCPTGATVKIEGERDMTTIDHNAESTHLRQMILHNDWTVKDKPFEFECDSTTKGETVDLTLKSGPGAAAIGGNRNENCGDITLKQCDLNLTPNGGVLPSDPESARRVHEIGDGLLDASGNLTLGGHVTFIDVPALKCPIRSAGSSINTRTLSRPRPHDEYGVPLTPVAMLGDWVVFFRPGVVNINGSMRPNVVIPRSGEIVR